MSNFTPGPWMSVKSLNTKSTRVKSKDCGFVAEIIEFGKETDANAHLIAAGPEMYEQLEFLKGVLENNSLASGDCCCGYPMNNHPVYENHSPVDSGEYAQKSIMQVLDAVLKKARGEVTGGN